MLSSARQGARRAPRLASLLSVPSAESSRQAQVRAMMPAAATGSKARGYSAAAVLAEGRARDGDGHGQGAAATSSSGSSSPSGSRSDPYSGIHSADAYPPSHSPSSPHSPPRPDTHAREAPLATPTARGLVVPIDAPLTPGERFARKVKIDTIGALRDLAFMGPDELATVDMKDIRHMLYWAQQDVAAAAAAVPGMSPITRDEAAASLRVVRSFLFAQPSRRHAAVRDAFLGKNMQRRPLRAFLRLAINLGCTRLAAETFHERLDEQMRTHEEIIDLESFAVDLAVAKQWALIAELFPGPSERLPPAIWTPEIVSIVIRANIALKRPQAAVDLFHRLDHQEIKPQALTALIQAYLELGDIPAAQRTAQFAHKHEISYREIQLAILRGYRMLGYDADVEERVRRGFGAMGIPLEAPILNAFIRLRLDAGDLLGAEEILHEFRLFDRPSGVEPTSATAVLALTVFMRRQTPEKFDLDTCVRMWNDIVASPDLVTDTTVAHLCRSLEYCGRADDVYDIFAAAVRGTQASQCVWALPANFTPGIVLANTVMEILLRSRRYDGLIDVGRLMTEGGIDPDERTIIAVLEFAARNLTTSPPALARLLNELNTRTGTPPTPDQLNVIMTEAIRASLRNPTSLARYVGAPVPGADAADVDSIQLRGELRSLLEGRIEFLKRNKVSRGRALRTRLMYDALALGDEPANRSIRSTWQAFVLRGYRPGARHYLSLLRAYAEIGALRDAEHVLKLVADDGMVPTTDMYAALIAAHGRAGNVKRARKWYDMVRRPPHSPDAAALCAILQSYTYHGDPNAAVEIAREDYAKVEVNENVVVAVAHALRKGRDLAGAIFFIAHHAQRKDRVASDAEVEAEAEAKAGDSVPGTAESDPVPPTSPSDTVSAPTSAAPTSASASAPNSTSCLPRPATTSTLPDSVAYILTPRLRSVVRKMLNYLGKQPPDTLDERTRSAYLLAERMLADDKVARPPPLRLPPRLSARNRHLLADKIARAAERDNLSVLPKLKGISMPLAQAAPAKEQRAQKRAREQAKEQQRPEASASDVD